MTYNSNKVFCIGFNKTGTTSILYALKKLGYKTGDQKRAEPLLKDWSNRRFDNLIKYCKYSGEAFQDIPFSLPYTYIVLDQYFKNSKFILTVRDSSNQWYNSIIKFHKKSFGNNKVPTNDELSKAKYVYNGFMLEYFDNVFGTVDNKHENPYNKDKLISTYENHNSNVKHYFSNRPEDLLVLNVSDDNSMIKLSNFLNIKTDITQMPHYNKTDEME